MNATNAVQRMIDHHLYEWKCCEFGSRAEAFKHVLWMRAMGDVEATGDSAVDAAYEQVAA